MHMLSGSSSIPVGLMDDLPFVPVPSLVPTGQGTEPGPWMFLVMYPPHPPPVGRILTGSCIINTYVTHM